VVAIEELAAIELNRENISAPKVRGCNRRVVVLEGWFLGGVSLFFMFFWCGWENSSLGHRAA